MSDLTKPKKKPDYLETVNYMLRTEEEKASGVTSSLTVAPPPLSMKHIVWGVFLGMWAFSITAGAVYYVLTHGTF